MLYYWLCLLLLVPCNLAEKLDVWVKNDGFHEWTRHISWNSNLKNTYKILPRHGLGSSWESSLLSSMDFKMERSDGSFWFEGRVTKNELIAHECITPTNFKYSRQPSPILVEICNNTIHLIPVGTIVNVCIDNQTPDGWMLWNVVQGNTLQNQTVDGGRKRCQLVQQYYSDGIFNIKLERVNNPWGGVYFPGFSQYDQPPCRLPYIFYYTEDQAFEATYCNATINLSTTTRALPKPDAFCIENRSLQQLFNRFSYHNGTFSLSFTDRLSPHLIILQARTRTCYRIFGNHNSSTIFNVNATYESDVVKGQFTRASQAPLKCIPPGKLVHTWENPPVEWYQCGNMLTVVQTNHTFCIENASPDFWTVKEVLEENADNWYPGRGPASVIASNVVHPRSKACYMLNKRHNIDEQFGLIFEGVDQKVLGLLVQHAGPRNEETWGASRLWVLSTWEEEIPYKLELYKNTLVLDSALDRKVKVCIDNQSFKTWTIVMVFDYSDSEWGIQQSPYQVLVNEGVVEETQMCYSLNQRHPNASFIVRMKQNDSEEWFEARLAIKTTETDDKCSRPENLKFSTQYSSIEPLLCNNTLTLFPVLRASSSTSCTHRMTTCKLHWETVGIMDNRENDKEVQRNYNLTIGVINGTNYGFTAEQWIQAKMAQQTEKPSPQRSNSKNGSENENDSQKRTDTRVGEENEVTGEQKMTGKTTDKEGGGVGGDFETDVNFGVVNFEVTLKSSFRTSFNAARKEEEDTESARGSKTDNHKDESNKKTRGSTTNEHKDQSNEKMYGLRTNHRNDEFQTKTIGSGKFQTKESGNDSERAVSEMVSNQFTWSSTITDTIKAGPFKMKKWQQKVMTCECFGYRLPLWRVKAVKHGSGSYGHSRRRRAHSLHNGLHHDRGHQCRKEGELRLISGSCDRHKECHHGRWVTRVNPSGKVMVAKGGTFALRTHVNGC